MDATTNVPESARSGNHSTSSAALQIRLAMAKLDSAVACIERAAAASDDGFKAPLSITKSEAQTAAHHLRIVLRETARAA